MRTLRPAVLLVLALSVAACAKGDTAADSTVAAGDSAAALPADTTRVATPLGPTAEMRDASGRLLGTMALSVAPTGIGVVGHVIGLAPGDHGIHIHTVGTCAAPFESAGPHWNPSNAQHGTSNPQGPHHGDLPNVTVGADSSVHVDVTTPAGALDSLLDADGASVVVHARADDLRTDPSGNSGDRVACGVITRR